MTDLLYAQEIAKLLLSLRECLVRHDENEKAYTLLAECTPYFLAGHEDLKQALIDQTAMTAHLRDADIYAEYYGNNPHELPFEQMFGRQVSEADTMPRIAWLKEKIVEHGYRSIVDLACNDGAILRFLLDTTSLDSTRSLGIDLNPTCVARATKERGIRAISARVETVDCGATQYDAAFAGEVIEHVPDPVLFLAKMAEFAPHLYVTTPLGATEHGNVPGWATVEYKGHVRAPTPADVVRWCSEANLEVIDLSLAGGDTLCLEAHVATSR